MGVTGGLIRFGRTGLTTGALIIAAFAGGCVEARSPHAVAVAEEYPTTRIDSILPIEEEIRRFRASLPDSVAVLTGGRASIDELVSDFLAALEAEDYDALAELRITPAEFAYLYYPETRFTHPPYEMSPGLLWFQLENFGSRGLNRAVTRYGGRELDAVGYVCPDGPLVEGQNRIWRGCLVQRLGGGKTESLSLFGEILERDGYYKFVGYGNGL